MASIRSALVLVVLPTAALFLGICFGSVVLPHANAYLRARAPPPLGWKSLTQVSSTLTGRSTGPHVDTCEEAALAAVRWADFFFDWQGDATLRRWIHRHPNDARFSLLPPFWPAVSSASVPVQPEDADGRSCLRKYGQGPTDRQKMDTSEAKLLLDLSYLSHPPASSSCVIFSIGGNAQVAFEESILNTTNCTVHQFDCTVSDGVMKPIVERMGHPGRFFFHSICAGRHALDEYGRPVPTRVSYDHRGQTDTVLQPMAYLVRNVTQVPAIDVLKFDAEGAEHDTLADMLDDFRADGIALPGQISMEVHMFKQGEIETFTYLRLFQKMFDTGYVLVSVEENPLGRHCCMEFTFVLGCGVVHMACGQQMAQSNATTAR